MELNRNYKLIAPFLVLLTLLLILSVAAYQLGVSHHLMFSLCLPYTLLGLGLAVPLILLAILLGWIQFLLLATGNISPHLAKEDFFKVLETLFSKI